MFGVYIHWPFCQAKCPYCDFNSHVVQSIDQRVWLEAYVADIESCARDLGPRLVHSVFFGGGTPSLMQPWVVEGVLEAIQKNWSITNDLEVTLEANPTSADAERFRGYRTAGVTRLSVGVQALDDASLKALGRLHTADEARQVIDLARLTFDRMSFDLMYARQDQGKSDWERELREALSLSPDHISLYQLTIESGTRFQELHKAGRLRGLPSEDLSADLYEMTDAICGEHGLNSYEVSNYAAPGEECRHNLIYWMMGEYAGIGPGAHGRVSKPTGRCATVAHSRPGDWLAAVREDGHGVESSTYLTEQEHIEDVLMMGLRLTDGIPVTRLHALNALPDQTTLDGLLSDGLIEEDTKALRTSRTGRLLLNEVLRRLL